MAKTADADGAQKEETRPLPTAAFVSPLDRKRAEQRARDYRGMTFGEMRAHASGEGAMVSAAEAGIGYILVENADDKEHFVGVELVVLPGWQVNESTKVKSTDPSKKRYFTSCYVKTAVGIPQLQGGTEFIINDGSTGIAQQLAELRLRLDAQNEKRAAAGLELLEEPAIYCKHGFRGSTYEITDKVFDDAGNPVIDPITRRQKRTPRLDPVTQQPMGEGTTYYLDTSA